MSISKHYLLRTILLTLLLSNLLHMACSRPAQTAVIETDFGKIKIKLYPDVAPKHVENFAKLAREGFFDGLAFHRIVPGLLIQGGDPQTRNGDPSLWGTGLPDQPTVPAEFSSKPFVRGAVGMARKGNDLDSATSQFFICLRDYPQWNGKYTVFGEVSEGIEVVDRISAQPNDRMTQRVLNKIVMKRVSIEN